MIAPSSAPPAAAPRLAPIFTPSLEFSDSVTPAAVPPPMKAPITPPPSAQPSQILGWPIFTQPLSTNARHVSTQVETGSLHEDLRRIVPPTRKKIAGWRSPAGVY